MKSTKEPSAAGALILAAIKRRHLSRPAVARAIGLTPEALYPFIWGLRPIPRARLEPLCKALRLSQGERDALILADHADRLRRSQAPTSQLS